MAFLIPSWRPKRRQIYYTEKPDFVPDWVYTEALAAKKYYNENWEFWVWQTAQDFNCPIPEAEDACIRGLKKVLLQCQLVYGQKVGQWYEDFMEMGDIFKKVNHPDYLPKLA